MRKLTFIFALLCVVLLSACTNNTTVSDPTLQQQEPKHEHYFINYEPNGDATCEKDGTKTAVCDCGKTDTVVDAGTAGHLFTNYISNGDASEIANGTKTATCDRIGCGAQDTCEEEGSTLIVFEALDDGKSYSVAGLRSTTVEKIDIPSKYNGLSVTEIASEAFENCTTIKTVTIAENVTAIGAGAFAGCGNLESITIPTSVSSIGWCAFSGCDRLEKLNISDISSWCVISFDGCESNPMYFADAIYINEKIVTEIEIKDDAPEISAYAFSGAKITSVKISNTVKKIGEGAFSACTSLSEITLPFVGDSAKSEQDTYQYPFGYIFGATSYDGGYDAEQIFYNDSIVIYDSYTYCIPNSLKSVVITGGNILLGAFYNCEKLENITIPDNITNISEAAFSGCSGLKSIELPESVKNISYRAFLGCTSLSSIKIPDNTEKIGDSAFENCIEFTNITIPDNVTEIGNSVFSGCTRLESVTLPFVGEELNGEDNTYFGYTFGASSAYEQGMYIPESLKTVYVTNATTLGAGAFSGCTGLANINLPENLIEIGARAFSGCTGITSIAIPDSVTELGYRAFYGCTELESISFGESRKLENIGGEVFYNCAKLKNVVIPNGVAVIGGGAFYGCKAITNITIPNGVKEICNGTFEGCSELLEAIIPAGVISIAKECFLGCEKLESLTLPFVGTENGALDYKGQLGQLFSRTLNSNGTYKYSVPSSLKNVTVTAATTIADGAFQNCYGLENIVIPSSVTTVSGTPFSNCGNLKYNEYENGFYLGNENNPHLILVKAKDKEITSATVHYNTQFICFAAFSGCANLERIDLTFVGDAKNEATATHLGYIFGAEKYSDNSSYVPSSLNYVLVSDSPTPLIIAPYAFYGCAGIETVFFGESVINIGAYAFYGCSNLSSVEFVVPHQFYAVETPDETSAVVYISTSSAEQNAINLKGAYSKYYWKR